MSTEPQSRFTSLVHLGAGSSPDEYIGPVAPEQGGITYGGQLLAQAVAAAHLTVDDDREVHSLHALFLRGGDVDLTTQWNVERIRDGRSFATRSVSGYQNDKEIFRVMVSFHVPESGLDYQPEVDFDMASVPEPDDVSTTYTDFCRAHPDLDDTDDWSGEDRPMEIRYIKPPDPSGGPSDVSPQLMWLRISEELPDDTVVHQAALAYLADSTLIDHILLPHGFRWHDARLTGVSLDHAMWFRRFQRADEWLLYDQRVESTGGARGLASGRFYNRSGQLVASCTQEGLMRWSEGR